MSNVVRIEFWYPGAQVTVETDLSQLEFAKSTLEEVFGPTQPPNAGAAPLVNEEIDIALTPEEVAFIIEKVQELAGPEPVDKVRLSLSEDSPTLALSRHKELEPDTPDLPDQPDPTTAQGPTLVED